jgi:exopolysaccharide biosynthesis polyprenyl glycosylphosphotransferase
MSVGSRRRAWFGQVRPSAGRFAIVFLTAYAGLAFSQPELPSLVAATALATCFLGVRQILQRMLPISLGLNPSFPPLALLVIALWPISLASSADDGVGPAQVLLISVALVLGVLLVERVADAPASRQRLLVVGASNGGEQLIRDVLLDTMLPFEVIGVVDDDLGSGIGPVPILGGVDELAGIVVDNSPDLVVLGDDSTQERALPQLLDVASVGFRVVPFHHFQEHAFGRVPVDHLSPGWFMSVLHLYQRRYSRLSQRVFDLVVVALALPFMVVLAPVLALLVRLSGPGPVLFRQVRLGEYGELFELIKFRTMVNGAEEPGTAVWADEEDPRITPVGRLLRRMRLDELPQLWNVVHGEMSIVGPRPERPEFMGLLQEEVPFWTRRHLVKPGLTGWAQVRYRYTSDAAGAAEKLAYDLYYLKHRSLMLDLAIVAQTAVTVAGGFGSR